MISSLILPTRNRVSHLKRCLNSIENETKLPYEVIIIIHEDDKKSKEFISNYSSKLNIRYFETDGGSCKARNLAIEHSLGDILVFIEDDIILEKNYINKLTKIFENNKINVLTGHIFDIGVLTSPWYVNKSELEYIYNRRNIEFFQNIINEIFKRSDEKIFLSPEFFKGKRLVIYKLLSLFRNFFKFLIIQEYPIKGKILPSGYRSASPPVAQIKGLKKVEWFFGGNFAIKKNIINKFKFNEEMELLPYALCEDLELSARIGKKYDIFISSDISAFHLSAKEGIKFNQKDRFKSIIVNFYRVSIIRGNKAAYWWSVMGLIVSRIFKIPLSYSNSISELKGIVEGINYLKKHNITKKDN